MTSPLTSTSALANSATALSSSSSSAAQTQQPIDENAFLKLLMAQMQNQDPTAPTDSTQFVTQLATFTQVQQSTTQTTTLTGIASQLQAMQSAQAGNLVGKTVTVNGSSMTYDGKTPPTPATVTLASPAASISVDVKDSQGNTVQSLSLGSSPAGSLSIPWNGNTQTGASASAGIYSVAVTAADAAGRPVSVSTSTSGQVAQVSYGGASPTVTLTSGVVAPVSQVSAVTSSSASATTATP